MKKSILFCLIAFTSGIAHTQRLEEWTQQRTTQERYHLEQLTAMKTFAGVIRDGYSTAHGGLSTIAGIRDDEWKAHEAYFLTFRDISPLLQNAVEVKALLEALRQFGKTTSTILAWSRTASHLLPPEKKYLEKILTSLAGENENSLQELLSVLRAGDLRVSFSGRWKRIHRFKQELAGRQDFLKGMYADALRLCEGRKKLLQVIQLSRKLHLQP